MPVRAKKFREVEGGGTTWYASRTEAVGLGRVVPSSSNDLLRLDVSFLSLHTADIFPRNKIRCRWVRRNNHFKCRALHALSRGPEVCHKAYTFRVQRRTHPTAKYKCRAEASGKTRSVGLARALSKLGYASRAQAAGPNAAGGVRPDGVGRRDAGGPGVVRRGQNESGGGGSSAA